MPTGDGTFALTAQDDGSVGLSDVSGLTSALSDKQDALQSGTNIKTINSQSILGSGDLTISTGFEGTTNRITVGGNADSNIESTILTSGTSTTVNNVTLTIPSAVGSTNVNLVLTPKGTGAIIGGPPPDGTSTGGNARGSNAIDIQKSRTSATQVASGINCVAVGNACTASGTDSVTIGRGSIGRGQTVAIGPNCDAGTNSGVAIGNSANASGNIVAYALGYYAVSSGEGSYALGSKVRANRTGQIAFTGGGNFAGGVFEATGDSISTLFGLRQKTTTNSGVEFPAHVKIPSGQVLSGMLNIHGIKSDGSAVAHYMRQFSIRNLFRTVSSVDAAADTITFTTDHNLVDDDPVRITSNSTMIQGLTAGTIYYAKVINSTTISVHSATPVGAGNLMNITGIGAGTRYMSSTKLIYTPVTIGTDFDSGTSLEIQAKNVAFTTNPILGSLTNDYLSITVTGIADETWRWTANVNAVETAYGT
jgi:hypothetical protein